MLRNAVVVWGCVKFPRKKRYEGVRFNVVSVKYEGVGGCQFSRKKALRST